jgi:hypothetical protein
MSNLKRYTMVIRRDENGFATPVLKVRQKGEVLKFDEVKEFLKPEHNSDYTKCASDIIGKVAHRLGYDLAYCSQETKSDMQLMVVELLDEHFA